MAKETHTPAGSAATELIIEVFRLNGDLLKSGDQLVKSLNLTSARWQVIGALVLADEPQTVPQIARRMGLTRQAVQRIANDLAKRKFMSFRECRTDRRTRLLAPTPRVREMYRRATERQVRWVNEICGCLKADDIRKAKVVVTALCQSCRQLDSAAYDNFTR